MINRVIAVILIFSVFQLTAIYVVCKLLGGDAVPGFVYYINSRTIFSPKLKDNIISLGKFCHILQELLPFLVRCITLYIYVL